MWTEQEVFDKVATHLIRQGRPALDDKADCRYRTDDGLKCAIGCLIPDSLYTPEIEERSVKDLIAIGFFSGISSSVKNLLMDLQTAHDSWYNTNGNPYIDIKKSLNHIALKYNLDALCLT